MLLLTEFLEYKFIEVLMYIKLKCNKFLRIRRLICFAKLFCKTSNKMTVVPILRHSAEGENFVDAIQSRVFRMMIAGAEGSLLRSVRVRRIVFRDGTLSSNRNQSITHIYYRISDAGENEEAHASSRKSLQETSRDIFRVLIILRGITSYMIC